MIIDGNKLADKIAEELKREITAEKERGGSFGLGVLLVGNNPASEIYIHMKRKRALELGIDFHLARFDDSSVGVIPTKEGSRDSSSLGMTERGKAEDLESEILKKIKTWNEDDKISGIILQLPIPKNLDKDKIINAIIPGKDVDGLTDVNQERLKNNEEGLYPATPTGVMEILKDNDVSIEGNTFAVLGQSKLVGGSLSTMLENIGAKVSRIDSKTQNVSEMTREANVVISAVGRPGLITEDMIKEGAVVIDVGITKTESGLKGDVDFGNVSKKASLITPVPGGVGPMTVISLMGNVVKAERLNNMT